MCVHSLIAVLVCSSMMRPFGKVIGCRRPRLLAEAAIQWIKIRKNVQFFGKLNCFFFFLLQRAKIKIFGNSYESKG